MYAELVHTGEHPVVHIVHLRAYMSVQSLGPKT